MTHVDALRAVILAHPAAVVLKDPKVADKLEDLGLIRRKPMTHSRYLATDKLQTYVVSTVTNALVELIGDGNG